LLNHGTTVALLADLLEHSRAAQACVGVALIDIDNFRLVNETHGHEAGDQAVLQVAEIIRAEFAETSILGRYGPDEFLVVAPPDHSANLERAIDRRRDRIAELSLQFGESERLPVTVGPAERSGFDVLAGLVLAVDAKDRYTKRHSEDVARYGLFLADRSGWILNCAGRLRSPASSTMSARSGSLMASAQTRPIDQR
jgi:diguanylate cyclase (GGDEF)-like protein